MALGPFEWKQGLLRKQIRVELSDESITLIADAKRTEIPYKDIKAVYFYQAPSAFITRTISLQIHSNSGTRITLAFSSLIFAMSDHYRVAKSAMGAFFGRYSAAAPGAEAVFGFPPSMSNGILWATATAGTLGYAFYSMWRDGMMATLLEYVTFAVVALFMVVLMAWHFRRHTGTMRVSAQELFEQLSA